MIAGSDPDDEDRNCGLGFLNIRMALLEEVQGHIYRGYVNSRPSDQTYLEQRRRFDL